MFGVQHMACFSSLTSNVKGLVHPSCTIPTDCKVTKEANSMASDNAGHRPLACSKEGR